MKTPWRLILNPKHWPLWTAIGLMRVLTFLPIPAQLVIARTLGRLMYRCLSELRFITLANIKTCFPEHSAEQQDRLAKASFIANAEFLFEIFISSWTPNHRFLAYGEIEGLHHLQAARQKGKGVILLSAHLMSPDTAVRLLTHHTDVCAMVHSFREPVFAHFMKTQRNKYAKEVIEFNNIRKALTILQRNDILWYASDLDLGRKSSLFLPFLGAKDAPTSTALCRLAKLSGAVVVPFFPYRRADGTGYHIKIGSPIEDFSSEDIPSDLVKINQIVSEAVLAQPEHYLWQYKRFKTRPQDTEPLYYRRSIKPKRLEHRDYIGHSADVELLEGTSKQPFVLRSSEPYLYRHFYHQPLYKRLVQGDAAKRFLKHARLCERLNIAAPIVKRLYWVPAIKANLVVYKEPDGINLLHYLKHNADQSCDSLRLEQFKNECKKKGLDCDALTAVDFYYCQRSMRLTLVSLEKVKPLTKKLIA